MLTVDAVKTHISNLTLSVSLLVYSSYSYLFLSSIFLLSLSLSSSFLPFSLLSLVLSLTPSFLSYSLLSLFLPPFSLSPSFNSRQSKVRGSNENRPKILVGDLVRLRPLFEDLDAMNKKHCPYIMQPFEFTGSVLSFKLANETCIVDFSIPAGSSLVRQLDYSGDIPLPITADTVNVMNGLRYHVRFTFERCGLAFTHKGSIT